MALCTGVLVLGELGLVLHTHSVVAVGESGVETALRAPWDYVLDGGQLYSAFTVPETWAFERLVPQPEPSPTYHAWDALQRKANGYGEGICGLKQP